MKTKRMSALQNKRNRAFDSHCFFIRYLSEEISEECKQLVDSLPTVKGLNGNNVYLYQGFWYPAIYLQAVINFQKHFKAEDQDVILVTIPKSGTTWLKALTFSLLNRKQYRPNSVKDHPLTTASPHVLVPFLELRVFFYGDIPDLSKVPAPRLFATHLPTVSLTESIKLSSCKIVYMCRNPKDTFISLWHFMNKLRPEALGDLPLQEAFDKFCRGGSAYGPYWDHVLGYWKESLKNPEKFLFLTYEEMKEEPAKQVKRLARFLDCPFSEKEENEGAIDEILKLCSFETLSSMEVSKTKVLSSGIECSAFYRKGEVGDWRNHLTDEMSKALDEITKEKCSGTGLKL